MNSSSGCSFILVLFVQVTGVSGGFAQGIFSPVAISLHKGTFLSFREVKLQTLSYLQVFNWFLVELIESKHQYRF